VQDVDADDGPRLATRGSRFLAALIDGFFATALSLAVMLPMYGTAYFRMATASKLSVLNGLIHYTTVYYAIEGWFLYQRSQSLGKMALSLRIVRVDGNAASFGRTFRLRLFAFGMLGFIPFAGPFVGVIDCLFIFRSSRRCLHDTVADTIVVSATSSRQDTAAR
jgi:uncharacterized RDD family membrane protein YckC